MKRRNLLKMIVIAAISWMYGMTSKAQEAYAVLSDDGETVTFYYDTQKESRGGIDIYHGASYFGDKSPYYNVKTAVFDVSFSNCEPTSTSSWFNTCENLTTIIGMENLNTSNVTKMRYMFGNCKSLTSLDLANFNTTNVTDMNSMFSYCSSLSDLDLTNFNTTNVTDMSGMFSNCSSLTSLDLTNFNTTNVTDMSIMFFNCSSLTGLDLSSFNTATVTNMRSMFSNCSSLTGLDLNNFNTTNVTNMSGMFSYCSSLSGLDLNNFNTANVTDMSEMFRRCSSLISLYLSNFNTINLINMKDMFNQCSSLTSIDLSSFDTSHVTNMYGVFHNCNLLTTIYVDEYKWNTESVTQSLFMFSGCKSLVGGNGTVFNSANTKAEYARVDKEGQPGYFTQKGGTTGIKSLSTVGNADGSTWYTLDGRYIIGEPKVKGVYIREGRKIIVKK